MVPALMRAIVASQLVSLLSAHAKRIYDEAVDGENKSWKSSDKCLTRFHCWHASLRPEMYEAATNKVSKPLLRSSCLGVGFIRAAVGSCYSVQSVHPAPNVGYW